MEWKKDGNGSNGAFSMQFDCTKVDMNRAWKIVSNVAMYKVDYFLLVPLLYD